MKKIVLLLCFLAISAVASGKYPGYCRPTEEKFTLVMDNAHLTTIMQKGGIHDDRGYVSGLKETLDAELFEFNDDLTTPKILSYLDKEGYRPATTIELVIFGSQYKNTENAVVELGSIYGKDEKGKDGPLVVFLKDKTLRLYFQANDIWKQGEWSFLGIKKPIVTVPATTAPAEPKILEATWKTSHTDGEYMEVNSDLRKKLTIILRREGLLDPVRIKTEVKMLGTVTVKITTTIVTDKDFLDVQSGITRLEGSIEEIMPAVWEEAIRKFMARGKK